MKAVLLVNLGSPKDLNLSSIKDYLMEFLTDDNVVDLPKIIQKILQGKLTPSTMRTKVNIGQCQRYKEQEIKPIPTNNFVESSFVIISFGFENHIIKHVPKTAGNEYKDG